MYNDIIEESWVYQEWAAREQRRTLLDIVQERFPEILHLVKKQAESIEDPEVQNAFEQCDTNLTLMRIRDMYFAFDRSQFRH